ncbi:MAG: RNA polymerase sigma factor [Phycisphaerae bacterium]|jgi:RNA polymerase sigma-70 factor (ECF subfamily)
MTNARSDIENQLLVMNAQDGSARAMEELVRRWQKRLWQHAYRLIGDTEASWDIMQQAWMGIIKGLSKLHDPAGFKAWAYRIVTNKSFDWIKKNRAEKKISIEEIDEQQCEEKKIAGVRELLAKLDMKKRLVISLYYFEQFSVAEISTAMGIPKGTVKSRLDSARNEFKKLWQQYSE